MSQSALKTITLTGSRPWLPQSLLHLAGELCHEFRFSKPERKILHKKKHESPSVWAQKSFVLTDGPLKGGFWKPEYAPWSVGMMDASFFPSVRRIYNCKAPQSAGSTLLKICLAYAMDRRPGNAIIAMPNMNAARRRFQDGLIKMIEASPVLSQLLTGQADDKGALRIQLLSMLIYAGWAGSPTSMGDFPAMYVQKDEADKWEESASSGEANSHDLIDKRIIAFGYDYKIWDNSTCTTESGHIWPALLTETQIISNFWVVCPECGTAQVMIFSQIKWPGGSSADPITVKAEKLAYYVCHACGAQWNDRQKTIAAQRAIADGRYGWRAVPSAEWLERFEALKKGDHQAMGDALDLGEHLRKYRPAFIGFHNPAWHCFPSLSDSAAAFLDAERNGLDKLKDFCNNYAAEPWKQVVIETRESEILKACCALPPQTVPSQAVALVCFVDMQRHGFWFVVRAFARDFTSWNIHHGQLPDWDEVEKLLFETSYPVEGSARSMRIWRAGLDTGGGKDKDNDISRTEEAYFWLRKNGQGRGCRVWGTKGASSAIAGGRLRVGKPLDKTPSGKPLPGGLQLIFLDTAQLKDAFHYRLGQTVTGGPQAAWLHDTTGSDYARQITAEKKQKNSQGVEEWIKTSKDNHYLDCEVGCLALADPEWPGGGVNLLLSAEEMEARAQQYGRRVRSKGEEA
ncbi:MAG: terminase gpA endonuclease subunit [Desulfurivibrionaceae bacterium]|jgi:phage terminase large subunit GpA-like protein